MQSNRIPDYVDLYRYPIDDLGGDAGKVFLARCHEQLDKSGALVLEGFINDRALTSILDDIETKVDEAYYCKTEHNIYLIDDDQAYPSSHPRNRKFVSSKGLLAYDQIPQDNFLRELYEWTPLRHFIAHLMGVPQLYPYVDAISPINVNVNLDGQQLGWHFDNSEFTTTLMLRPAQAGGVYEYVPFIRSPTHENYESIADVLDDRPAGVQHLLQGAGALVIFKGKYTLHQVTPTVGPARYVAVMTFSPEPGKTITARTRQIFYGREA